MPGRPMSFHSSFHFKALYMLAQRYEVWIPFLSLCPTPICLRQGEPHVLAVNIFWMKHPYCILIDPLTFIITSFLFKYIVAFKHNAQVDPISKYLDRASVSFMM